MLKDALKILSSETSPRSKPFFNVGKANARIKELEAQLSPLAKVAQPVRSTAPLARTATANALAAIAAPGGDSIAPITLTALAQAVFGPAAASTFEAQRLEFTRAGLTVPGLEPAPANRHFTPSFVGLARSIRGDRQQKIDNFFRK